MSTQALDGVRVLEVGQLLAGPFAGTILGYFGAKVGQDGIILAPHTLPPS